MQWSYKMTEEIITTPATTQPNEVLPVEKEKTPEAYRELIWLAQMALASGVYPDSYAVTVNNVKGGKIDQKPTIAKIFIGMQKAKEVGLDPLTGLSTIYVINGKPTLYGDGATALILPYVTKYEETFSGTPETPEWKCTVKIWRKKVENPFVGEFSWKDAIDARLTVKTGPWKEYKARMLKNRARAFAIRDGFADCLHGLGIYEEMLDTVQETPRTEDKTFLDDKPPQLTDETKEKENGIVQ
jgi:hypothetical protein